MKVLIACEYSGIVRDAFTARGHDAWSCDLLPTERPGKHLRMDVRRLLYGGWDMLIAHPDCTRLCLSGVQWLHSRNLWDEMKRAAEFYLQLRAARIPKKALENPVMHGYALELIRPRNRQFVQPWWFGEPFFKKTGLELVGLPPLEPTDKLTPPPPGTEEHKRWSAVHRAPPEDDRWRDRSRTFPGIAAAMATQWG